MNYLEMILVAMLVDALVGEPKLIWSRIPHPVALMGRAIDALEARLNRGAARMLKGGLAIGILVVVAALIGIALALAPGNQIWQLVVAMVLIAHKSLIQHVRAVADALDESIFEGRRAVSLIVGRDTGAMEESDVSRAAIESAAENFSDGVVAPIFWFLLFGAPGILVYKMVNTADSVIGHKNERYLLFGRAAAKLDDALNWVPARITAGLFCLIGRRPGAWAATSEDAVFHRSPNAGWPEAALAVTMGIALAGPRAYHGEMTHDPYMNAQGRRHLNRDDIRKAVRKLWGGWVMLGALLALVAGLIALA